MFGLGLIRGFFMMNKGLLYTAMTVFLIFGVIALNEVLGNSVRGFNPSNESIALGEVSTTYLNAYSILMDYDKKYYDYLRNNNGLPFSFALEPDKNTFVLAQEYSLGSAQIIDYFNYINLAEIFLEDKNISGLSNDLIIDINSPKNPSWGGTDSINFILQPFCYKYTILNEQHSVFSKSSNNICDKNFEDSMIKRIDLNLVVLSSLADFNSFLCNGEPCTENTFDPFNPNPFFSIQVLDSNCSKCDLASKKASGHFSPSQDLNFSLFCVGPNCSPEDVLIKINDLDIDFDYSSEKKVRIETKITFSEPPKSFSPMDINIFVSMRSNSVASKSFK